MSTCSQFFLASVAFLAPLLALAESDHHAFVGSATCKTCHEIESNDWKGSDHDWAMRPATTENVLGDFDGSELKTGKRVARFYKKDSSYFIEADGEDGKTGSFEVAYTFGFYPLQQYLLELPQGRFQAFTDAWDSRPSTEGGQRWYHLDVPSESESAQSLHWTGEFYNWNSSCAECHSTDLKKNYDLKTDAYQTSWAEMQVGCEGCHGPGAGHVRWAKEGKKGAPVRLPANLAESSSFSFKKDESVASLQSVSEGNPQAENCGRCHSRRAALTDDYIYGAPLLNTHRVSLLAENLYHVDGQIDDEVYVYGSFLQSKMFKAGVTCTNCHNPHSLKLKGEGNLLCLQCHKTETYASSKHHFHDPESDGGLCVNCHMPTKVYMGTDARRDHKFVIPRPDLSDALDTPNACTSCHTEKTNSWAASKTAQWYPGAREKTFGELLSSARKGDPDILSSLLSFVADRERATIQRATLLAELPTYPQMETLQAIAAAGQEEDPLMRLAAAGTLTRLPPEAALSIAKKLLADPVRSVRLEAFGEMLPYLRSPYGESIHEGMSAVEREYVRTQTFNGDRADGWVNLGILYGYQGKFDDAEKAYLTAIKRDANSVRAYVNLSDLYRVAKKDEKAEQLLRKSLTALPRNAELSHALGLTLVRRKKSKEALPFLENAASERPENSRFQYVYAVALYSAGLKSKALEVVRKALINHPNDTGLVELMNLYGKKS